MQRHEVLDWLGGRRADEDRAQRLELANAIIASGSDDEATWLAIMERTVAERPALTREAMSGAGIDVARGSRTPDRPCMESAAA